MNILRLLQRSRGLRKSGSVQHLDPLFQRRTGIFLMGEYSRDDANDQIHCVRRLRQFECAIVGGLKLPARIPILGPLSRIWR